ncbi:MAG: hypothetical protein GZ094_02445 [Mariniphaga sp.]|nr:hypothetical protein [Mariniphaga sp.]
MRNNQLRFGFRFLSLTISLLFVGAFLIASCKKSTTIEDPGTGNTGRIISFSGYNWLVKSSSATISGTAAPGNNYYSDSTENVWTDKNGWLHLKITNRNNRWYCAEVTLTKSLGYKKYIFQVNGRIDLFHPNVVVGLFSYLDGTDNAEEIDIEFSKWGVSNNANMLHYAIQPSNISGNTQSFGIDLNVNASTHVFDWKPEKVAFASYQGYHSSVPTDNTMVISTWNYTDKDIPIDLNGKIHINLWLFQREMIDPNDRPEAELVIKSFQAL